ncbi:MAG: hypothetical protein IJ439_00495 [Tyzzerella sp.]|nr:hypothetical protein [Tyzzerella sp.]
MEGNNENTFEYTYSAKRQEEIEKIKSKYVEKEEDKMEMLRKLDQSVERPGNMAAIIIGVIGTLIMGTGMSLIMVWQDTFLILGIVIGVIGMAILGAAYPVYRSITKKQKEKLAPQILALTEELLK